MKKLYFLSLSVLFSFISFGQCDGLIISEYVEGSNNSKAIEIYNASNAAIDLGSYAFKRYSNGSTSNPNVLVLSGTIQAYEAIVIANGQTDSVDLGGGAWSTPCDPALQALADILDADYPAPSYFNGDDALTIELNSGAIVDIFGKVGEDPGQAWTNDPTANYTDANGGTWLTKDRTLVRHPDVQDGVTTNPALFIVLNEYDTLPKNYWGGLGTHACTCDPNYTSIQESNKINLSVYPNPVSDGVVTIATSEEITRVYVYDLLGQRMEINSVIYNGQIAYIRNLKIPNGMYIVEAETIHGNLLKKRIVVR